MQVKRFLLHDPELKGEQLSCKRCAKRLKVSPAGGQDLYQAMQQMDKESCSKAELDKQGLPIPVS